MRIRYLFLGMLLAPVAMSVCYGWSFQPSYYLSGENRRFLADDDSRQELLFLVYDEKAQSPPLIERRTARTGQLLSETSLEWGQMGVFSGRQHKAIFSADRSLLVWLQELSAFTNAIGTCRCAVFSVTSGKQVSDVIAFDGFSNCYLSSNGRWLMFRKYPNYCAVIYDVNNKVIYHEVASPNNEIASLHACFSPNSEQVIFQWSNAGPKGGELGRTLHLFDLPNRKLVQTFVLPETMLATEPVRESDDRSLNVSDWRPNELRTCFHQWPYRRFPLPFSHEHLTRTYIHRFDGNRLREGRAIELLDTWSQFASGKLDNCGEGNDWVGQCFVDSLRVHESKWCTTLRKLERKIGISLVDWLGPTKYHGNAKIIEKKTKETRFEMDLRSPVGCTLVLNGEYLIAHAGGPEYPNIEVWRVSSVGHWLYYVVVPGIATVALFALSSRLRYSAINHKTTN
jgi:hypothetical protein